MLKEMVSRIRLLIEEKSLTPGESFFDPTSCSRYTSGMLAELARHPEGELIPEVAELYNATHSPRPLRYSADNFGRFGAPSKLRT